MTTHLDLHTITAADLPAPTAPAAPTATPWEDVALDPQRLRAARKAYTTRYAALAMDADPHGYGLLSGDGVRPQAGDLVLARIEKIGQHKRLESPHSRRQLLFAGQEILVAYGDRYAPDQFLAEVPADLGPCQLVAAGGIAGRVQAQHAGMQDATEIVPLGLLTREGSRVNLSDFAPLAPTPTPTRPTGATGATGSIGQAGTGGERPRVVAVLGTSMNSGKSTTLACLVNGLTNAGLRVGAGKATGTGAGGDANMFRDAGAARVIDFTDFGLPSTFGLELDRVRDLWGSTVEALAEDGPDVVVVEIADGLYQGETSRLLADPAFGERVDAVVFAAQDALGATAGVAALREYGLPVVAASGVVTASPLAAAEAASALPVEVIGTYDLCDPERATALISAVPSARTA